jgi:hypothetical protein
LVDSLSLVSFGPFSVPFIGGKVIRGKVFLPVVFTGTYLIYITICMSFMYHIYSYMIVRYK